MKTFKEILLEKRVSNKWDSSYKPLIKKMKKDIPWDNKPVIEMINGNRDITGSVNGIKISLGWSQPSSRWGKSWMFNGLILKSKRKFDVSLNEYQNSNFIDNIPDDLQKRNIKEFDDAIKFVIKMK